MNPKHDFVGTKTIRKYENVTTPAGTFEGYKISQDIDTGGNHILDINRWYGAVGLLRHEEYSRETRLAENGLSMVSRHYHSVVELTGFTLK